MERSSPDWTRARTWATEVARISATSASVRKRRPGPVSERGAGDCGMASLCHRLPSFPAALPCLAVDIVPKWLWTTSLQAEGRGHDGVMAEPGPERDRSPD